MQSTELLAGLSSNLGAIVRQAVGHAIGRRPGSSHRRAINSSSTETIPGHRPSRCQSGRASCPSRPRSYQRSLRQSYWSKARSSALATVDSDDQRSAARPTPSFRPANQRQRLAVCSHSDGRSLQSIQHRSLTAKPPATARIIVSSSQSSHRSRYLSHHSATVWTIA